MHAPVLVSAPSATPVSLSEAKMHLRVDSTDEDDLITSLVKSATDHLDGYRGILGRCLVTQTWRQDFDGFSGRILRLPLLAATIASVKVLSSSDDLSTISADDYALRQDALGSYVRFDDEYSLPGDLAQSNAVQVEFTAGFGEAAAVPAALKTAILLLVAHWYQHREAAGESLSELPFGVAALIAPYRRAGV